MINGIGLKQAQCWQALCKHQHCKHASILTCSTFSVPISHNSGTDPASPMPDGLYISKAHNSWDEVGKVMWTAKPVMLCLCHCLSRGSTGFLGMVFIQVDSVCGLCTSSWRLLQYEPELAAEQSCSWSYPGRDFLSRWKVGCGPHLCGHIEGGVLGVFNQKRVCICFLNSSVGLWALQWGHGQELFPAPWTSWLHQLCRTWTLTAPSPPAQLLSSSQILRGLKLIYVNGWWPCNAQWTSFLWAGKYVVLKRVGIFFSPFLFSSLLSFGKMR